MSQNDDHWGAEDDDVVRRLREEKPQLSAYELDRVKTAVMAKARPSRSGRSTPRRSMRSRFIIAALTLGLMASGTAGAVAAGGGFGGFPSFFGFGIGSRGGTSAVQAQYTNPCQNAAFPLLCECRHHPAICYCLITGFFGRGCQSNTGFDRFLFFDRKLVGSAAARGSTRVRATTKLSKVAGSRSSPGLFLSVKTAKAGKGR
jgi:hypothetical protein